MSIELAILKLKENEIPCVHSRVKGYDYFIQDNGDDLTLTDEENETSQSFGVHLTEQQVIDFSKTL
jgi:hypothetical protein